MQSFFEWFKSDELNRLKPWLILGKGPSFSKRSRFDLSDYHTMSLNHAVREQPVDVAHMIDFDVVDACGDAIPRNARVLVLPWVPHRDNRPGAENLEQLVQRHPTLRHLDQENRLLWYHLCTAGRPEGSIPVIGVRFFSAEAALNLLASAGVRTIRSLGVDGGTHYSEEFDDLKNKTLLVNRRKSFNEQFGEIARIIMKTGIDYAPLDVESPVRIYVGSTEAQMLPVKVLEYSIRKHASMSVEIFPLHLSGIEIPMPRDRRNYPRTPFSFQRFLIPELTRHQGRAIYLDSDMQVFKDIRALWTMPFDGADLITVREPVSTGRQSQFSVMLLRCNSLKWDVHEIIAALDEGLVTYERLVYKMLLANNIRFDVDPAWNELERFSDRETALLHFTDMTTQPWVSKKNPLGYLWTRDLFEAVDSGFIQIEYIKQHVAKGTVRPSLLYQLEYRIEDSLLLPREARHLDREFIPLYHATAKRGGFPSLRPTELLRAAVRHYYHKSPLFQYQRKLHDWLSK
jgi:hypothetical protein